MEDLFRRHLSLEGATSVLLGLRILLTLMLNRKRYYITTKYGAQILFGTTGQLGGTRETTFHV